MSLFCIVLVVVAVSAVIINLRRQEMSRQEKIARDITQGAGELGYLSQDYVIYGERQQLDRWQSLYTAFSSKVACLQANRPEHIVLISNIREDQKRLKEVFETIVSTVDNRSRAQETIIDLNRLQVAWSRMTIQTQGLVSEASRLSRALRQDMDRLTSKRTWVMYTLIVLLCAFILATYLLSYRRILKSIAVFQAGAAVIGSGNLDFHIKEERRDEFGDLSRAFNRMTADLKEVTASKAELEKEITDREYAEQALHEKMLEYEAMFERSIVGKAEADPITGRFMKVNQALADMTGYSSEELRRMTFADITHPDDRERDFQEFEAVRAGAADKWQIEKRCLKKDGSIIWMNVSGNLIRFDDGRPTCTIAVIQDISERKQAEDELKSSLSEKDVLLKEIHHRVKNNMQVISSLVDLQANEVKDKALHAIFKDVIHRVRSMAMVHEKLYQSTDFARVEFADYARSLLGYLWHSQGTVAPGVQLKLDLEPVLLPVNEAVPCGLILNELFTNSLKHAFASRDNGTVTVSLRRDGAGKVSMTVQDNGIGLPPEIDIKQAPSLGLRLVQMLARQLHAVMESQTDNGTKITIAFKVPQS